MIDGEKNIIERAIGGEASAFGRLYDEYQPKIYRFIYLKVGHREEAEDLCHQTFISAWENINNYRFQGYLFSTWLYSIARNKVIDYYRAKKTTVNLEIETIKILEIGVSNEQLIDTRLEMEKTKDAILKLNSLEQDVIIMRFIEDLSPKEIAKSLDKSEVAIRQIQHRAIKNLKKILEINE